MRVNERREIANRVNTRLRQKLEEHGSAFTNVMMVHSVMGTLLRPSEVFVVAGTVPTTNDLTFLMQQLLKANPPGHISFSVWVDAPGQHDSGEIDQPSDPANGSQPTRSEVNSTSSAAGSSR
jgi:hypothetical protein